MGKKDAFFMLAIVAVLATIMLVCGSTTGTAEVPELFSQGHTLAQARVLSAETGKPILAFATADWCPPCQAMKRGTLTDPDLTAYLKEHTIPVYLDEAVAQDDIAALGTRAYPTTFIIVDGRTVATQEGGASATDYLRLVRTAIADPD